MTKNKYAFSVLLLLAAAFGFFAAMVYQTGTFLTITDAIQKWSLWASFATCASALIAAGAIWVAVWSYRSQVEQSKITLAVQILMKLEDDFDNPRMRAKRARAAKALRSQPREGTADIDAILDFFEGVALYERSDAIGAEFVWHGFYLWFSYYYHLTTAYRTEVRKDDAKTWADLDRLYTQTSFFEGKNQPLTPTPAEQAEFLSDEIALLD
ncbi:hypothetical protein PQR34_25890 [Paraburkholderia sediminicola]|uniref:DUF4760 domain-containing protein n=1 Tax=Paraburkholderia sediminicola TaxID=458836 RepID=UPI0038BA03F3